MAAARALNCRGAVEGLQEGGQRAPNTSSDATGVAGRVSDGTSIASSDSAAGDEQQQPVPGCVQRPGVVRVLQHERLEAEEREPQFAEPAAPR